MPHELSIFAGTYDESRTWAEREQAHGRFAQALAHIVAQAFIFVTRLVTDATARWAGCQPEDKVRIYFANHTSHLDFMLLWTVLPKALRAKTRPVAAADYWQAGPVRRYLSERVFRCVFIDRQPGCHVDLLPLLRALDRGESLILFPEGTRGTGDALEQFRAGIFHIAEQRRAIELVPVWMDNNHRVLPKGSFVPLPVLCTATFGTPMRLEDGETKSEFLQRSRQSLLTARIL